VLALEMPWRVLSSECGTERVPDPTSSVARRRL